VILRLAENGRFNGTAEALLARLNVIATDDEKRAPGWPKTAHRLGNAVKRAAPALRRADIAVTSARTKHARMILIEGGAKTPSPLSPLSPRTVFRGPGDSGDNGDSRFGPPSTSAARGDAGCTVSGVTDDTVRHGNGEGRESFTPTAEWQEVPEGAILPAGLEIRMDMDGGPKRVRLKPDEPEGFDL
jgi:hypothetical protein